jgi:hypothetical protein
MHSKSDLSPAGSKKKGSLVHCKFSGTTLFSKPPAVIKMPKVRCAIPRDKRIMGASIPSDKAAGEISCS